MAVLNPTYMPSSSVKPILSGTKQLEHTRTKRKTKIKKTSLRNQRRKRKRRYQKTKMERRLRVLMLMKMVKLQKRSGKRTRVICQLYLPLPKSLKSKELVNLRKEILVASQETPMAKNFGQSKSLHLAMTRLFKIRLCTSQ